MNNNPWPTQFTLPCPTTNALHSVGVIKCTKTPKKNTFTIKLKLADTDTQPSTTNTTTTIALAAMTQEVIYSHHVDMSIESIYQIMLNAMDIIWQLEDVPLNALHYEAFAIGKHGSSACTAINNTSNTNTTTTTSTITYTLQQLLSMAEAYLVTTPTPTATNNNRAAKTSKDTNSTANNNSSNIGEDMKGMTYLKSGDIPMNFIAHYLDILNLQNNTNTNNSNIVFPTPSLNFIPVHAENQDTAFHATFRRSLAGLIR